MPPPRLRTNKKARKALEDSGWKKGDKALIRAKGTTFRVVVVGPADFVGWVYVAWAGTRHTSRARIDWLENPPKRNRR